MRTPLNRRHLVSSTLTQAWKIYRSQFVLILALAALIWLPCELLSSYCEAFVFKSAHASSQLARLLDHFVGIIATAAIVCTAMVAHDGKRITFDYALAGGLSAWWRMWWTRFLCALLILVGLLMLIIPGLYIATRLFFIDSVVVAEGISGTAAIGRTFDLTKNRFGPSLLLICAIYGVLIVPACAFALPATFISALDHWIVQATASFACDLVGAFASVAFFCAYKGYAQSSVPPTPPTGF